MEREQGNGNNALEINAHEFIAKYNDPKARELYCIEKNWWMPNEVGFDSSYFLQVIAGRKKYLPANFTLKSKLGYFRKGETLSKEYILQKMQGNEEFGNYVPDRCDPKKLSRDFLLTLVAFVDPQLYRSFYATYKEEVEKRAFNKWADYKITVAQENAQDIEEFVPLNYKKSKKGGFRLFKNHMPTNVFKQFQNANQPNANNNNPNVLIQHQQEQINQLQEQNNINQNVIQNLNQQLQNQNAPNQQAQNELNAFREAYHNLEVQFNAQKNALVEMQNKNNAFEREKKELISKIQASTIRAQHLESFINENKEKLNLSSDYNEANDIDISTEKSNKAERKVKQKK